MHLVAPGPRQQAIVVLGSTGSVGVSTLDVIARHPARFRVFALAAKRRVDALLAQCVAFTPQFAVLNDAAAAEDLSAKVRRAGLPTQVLSGDAALEQLVASPDVDVVMAAIVGIAGLPATLAAARAGKRLLLANKEALVSAGPVFMQAVSRHGATLIPIDSEHNAIFQALPSAARRDLAAAGVRRIVLTASGGPFRTTALERLAHVTPDQACAHPNWVMGRKISVDSATMMNKGLEVIEAARLFDASDEQIAVVIHPESIIHSLVEYIDGSLLAQLSNPDMRTPIAHALGYPERIEAGVEFLDLAASRPLHFAAPDTARFPCLALARRALRAGGTAPTLLNAANEIAVAAFLEHKLGFTAIPALVGHVLTESRSSPPASLDEVLAADAQGRERARAWLAAANSRSTKAPREIVLAKPRGFCAGVVRAIDVVEQALRLFGAPVYVLHEIVHNQHVVNDLRAKGAVFTEDLAEVPVGAVTIFSAHGVSEQRVADARARGLRIIDATCPLVAKVHTQAQRYHREGYELIIVGHRGHPEVEGTSGRVPGPVHVISTPQEVQGLELRNPERVAYVTQTTLSVDDTRAVIDALRARFPAIIGPDTRDICYATQNRQNAVRGLAENADVIVVVGARNSSNSNRLREVGELAGVRAYLVQDAEELRGEWFDGARRIGVSAGASTPEALVVAVLERLSRLGHANVREMEGPDEQVTFRPPPELRECVGEAGA